MTDSKEATRDWMAARYALNRFPIQNIETGKDPTQDINFLRRITVAESYRVGFDAGYQVAMDEANDKIYHATRKVPELEYEKEHLRLTLLSECKNHKYSLDRIEDLKERIQNLREALTYYAYANKMQGPDFITVELHEMIIDNGKTARTALKEDEESQ